MAVRFIIGRAGSGKTERCVRRIVEAVRAEPLGPTIVWIVPKQATFQAERELTAELGAFARVRVVSFESLGQEILAECGGTATPEVTSYGRQMILAWLLKRMGPELKFFAGVARQPGLATKLDATFAELERHGKTPGDLRELSGQLEESQDEAAAGLAAKVADLQRVYEAYTAYLGQDRLDPHRRLEEVLRRMEGCRLLRGATVFVDGFLDYSEHERRMLCGIAKACRDLEVTVLADPTAKVFETPHHIPDEMGLFHRTETGYRKLYFALSAENVAVDRHVELKSGRRYASGAIRKLEQELFEFGGIFQAEEEPAGLHLVEARNHRAEVDAAAARVKELVRQGMRWRDVLVLTRDAGTYAEIIDASFREHGIPYFLDRRRTAAHHPLLQFLRGIFAVVMHGWPHEAVMGVVKTGLCGLDSDEADELENYVLSHRLRGPAWTADETWTYRRAKTRGGGGGADDEELLKPEEREAAMRAEALRRRVSTPLLAFQQRTRKSADLTVRDAVRETFELFDRFKVREQLAAWITQADAAGDVEQRSEHEQVWEELLELFDQMVELLGGEKIGIADFVEILDSGLETFSLALTPPTVDQVLVGQVDRTRSPHVKATIVLGLSEGQFPQGLRQDSVLSDAERKELRQRQVELEGDSERRALDESLLGYLAFTRASERLILTRSCSNGKGKAIGPSVFWKEMRGMFPGVVVERDDAAEDRVRNITTPRQLVEGLMGWVRGKSENGPRMNADGDADPRGSDGGQDGPVGNRAPEAAEGSWAALYQWFAGYDCCDDSIDVMRYRAWRALSYDNSAALSADVTRKLFERPLVASVSQLETFAACPFKHFVRYGLGLEVRQEDEPTAIDLGNVYHETLEKIVTAVLREKLDWAQIPDDRCAELVRTCTQEVGQTLRDELMMSGARNQHLLSWIERTLGKVTSAQKVASGRGAFRPAFAELTFGRNDAPLPPLVLRTPKGEEVWLRGKIDRVDVLPADAAGEGAFAVIDYKTSDRRLELHRVWHGLSLQLLAYMVVLREHGERLAGKKLAPAAAFYVKLLRRLELVDHPGDAVPPEEPVFHLKTKPRGIVHEGYANGFDAQFGPGMSSDVIQAKLKKDGTPAAIGNDLARGEEIDGLLEYVKSKVGELADEILSGVVDVRPYKMRTETPCPNCEYRSVCRFQPGMNRYLHVEILGRDQVIGRINDRGGDDVE